MFDARLKMSSPWVTYVNALKALFNNDPEIEVVYNDLTTQVKLYVDNAAKAEAIDWILPDEQEFGNVTLDIVVIPPNDDYFDFSEKDYQEIFDIAFEGNPVYAFSKAVQGMLNNKIFYIVFKNKVVQFFNDNLNDLYGNISTLYQELAKEVLNCEYMPNVFFCTDIKEKVGEMKNWP